MALRVEGIWGSDLKKKLVPKYSGDQPPLTSAPIRIEFISPIIDPKGAPHPNKNVSSPTARLNDSILFRNTWARVSVGS
jgi:hypothetical protein